MIPVSEEDQSAASWTWRAIQEIQGGEAADARAMLAEAIRLDPDFETAWLWFATLARSDGERRFIYERVVALNPDSPAAGDLARTPPVRPTPPPELAALVEPPIPEMFGGAKPVRAKRRPRWPFALGALLAIVLLAAGGYAFYDYWDSRDQQEPLYLAFVADYSGPGGPLAREMEQAVRLYLEIVNSAGGIGNHPVELVTFDDENDLTVAVHRAQEIASDDRILAVIGHRTSVTAMAAKPVYEAERIPVITGTATADTLTMFSDWHFRTVIDNRQQGELLAAYVSSVLGEEAVTLVVESNVYGHSLAESFVRVFRAGGGEITARFDLSSDSEVRAEELPALVDQLAADGNDTPIFLAANAVVAQEAIIALRDAGRSNLLIGADAIGFDSFLESFADLPAERHDPGFYTNGLFATAPVMMDSLTGDGVRTLALFEQEYGYTPSWRALTTFDAAISLVNALTSSLEAIDDGLDVDLQRAAIRNALAAADGPDVAIPGTTGPIWFDEANSVVRPVAIGEAHQHQFSSAPIQLSLFREGSITHHVSEDDIVQVGELRFHQKRVAFAGIDITLIRDLSSRDETFFADFYFWLKYPGSDDAADFVFTNWTNIEDFLIDEVRASEIDGLNYRLYRITGTFKSRLQFQDYPFDRQALNIQIQNRHLSSDELVYAVYPDFLRTPPHELLTTGEYANESILQLPNWRAESMAMVQATIGTVSALGDPRLDQTGSGLEHSELIATVLIERKVEQFLIKNLLPLAILVVITYISLFFSHTQTTERVSFGITGALTGAVLLSGVTGLLPDIGYTLAIEWAFYAFIVLSAGCILVALIGHRWQEAKQFTELRQLDTAARILYPLIVAVVVVAYWYHFFK